MNRNIGGIDRVLRIVIGVWGWIGVVPLGTGAIGWCPGYLPFGFSTCRQG